MKAKFGVFIVIAIVTAMIITIVSVGPIDISEPKPKDEFQNWNRSGPFGINKFEYKLGENIFIIAQGLTFNDSGNATFVMPNGTTKYITIPFDGSTKSGFNQYFKPAASKSRNICSINDLIGEWSVIFTNTNYQPLRFKIINQTISTEVGIFEKVC